MRYTVTLPPPVERSLTNVAGQLHISKSEAFRRALTLLEHAVEADKVILKKDGEEQTVLVK